MVDVESDSPVFDPSDASPRATTEAGPPLLGDGNKRRRLGASAEANLAKVMAAQRAAGGQPQLGDPSDRRVSAVTGSVCKLFVKKVPANFADPWRKHSQSSSTGTGFLMGGRWIVTNAHVVHRAVSVLVKATIGPPVKYNARVVCVGLPCDLAVLSVDGDFWQGKESLELAKELPRLDDNVTCIGFPMGGENISVTRGVVSRIDVNLEGLNRIQIDAAINPGNSGGPVLGAHGLVVGIASSHLKHASNIGYIIPSAVLEQFLTCASGGPDAPPYMGVASLGIGRVQMLESPALRRHLKLPEDFTGGVRIPSVSALGASADKLEVDDVLVAVDGVEIGQDGTVPLRENERIHFLHLITRRLAGRDMARVKVMRRGKELEVEVQVRPEKWLVPRIDGYDAAPEYCIIGGLVFVPLSLPWMELKSNDKSARALMLEWWGKPLTELSQQIVIVSKVLAHPCNFGFHNLGNMALDSFNGVKIHNLAQLAQLADASETPQLSFEFLRPAGDGKELVVLDQAECKAAEAEILAQHLIAHPGMVRRAASGSVWDLIPTRRRSGEEASMSTSAM
eukprot:TRINITY_DN39775_c0_g1_i1.p1 TRINITY_DN39775_c0_g1~~TRINITY_DN39775_c0_g1_i1.p1  ORF type:complete len:565 (+),score=125.89 TRINITY_DN39775_c0_g1_i1:72-1766(+)